MRKRVGWMSLAMMMAGAVVRGEEAAEPVAAVQQSLEQMSAEAQRILARNDVYAAFDFFRKMKDYGITYQADLPAPNDLVGVLDRQQLRHYAGIKLFDALYAATFMKRKDVAACVAVIEDVQTTLDLRSHVDIDSSYLTTLKQTAAKPEEVDVHELIAQLADDYTSEVPDLMASFEGADYLIDGLFGFMLESFYIQGMLANEGNRERLEEGFNQFTSAPFLKMVLDLFEAFNRMDETVRISGETQKKLAVLQQIYELDRAEEMGEISDQEADLLWSSLEVRLALLRAAILSPSSTDR